MSDVKYLIFLPVRNGGSYLAEAIDSVFAQTHGDWQLVILENDSSDETSAILTRYDDRRLTIVRSDRALSIVENWQRAYALLQSGAVAGKYVTFIGHDDRFAAGFLTAIDSLVEASPNMGLYQTYFDLIDEHGAMIRPCRPIPIRETSTDFFAARAWGLRDSFGTGYVFSAANYIAVGGIPALPQLLFADDLLFARLAARGGKACHQTSQCSYRLHRGSASRTVTAARINNHLEALSTFITALRAEFPEFEASNGRAALACLIAREIFVFDTVLLRWALEPANRQRVTSLLSTFSEMANGVPRAQWLNANFRGGSVYLVIRRLALAVTLARALLFRAKMPRDPFAARPSATVPRPARVGLGNRD